MIVSGLIGGIFGKVAGKKALAFCALAACGTDLAVVEEHRQIAADTAVAVIAPTPLGEAMHLQKDNLGIETMRIDAYMDRIYNMCERPYWSHVNVDGSVSKYAVHLLDRDYNDYPCPEGSKGREIQMKAAQQLKRSLG